MCKYDKLARYSKCLQFCTLSGFAHLVEPLLFQTEAQTALLESQFTDAEETFCTGQEVHQMYIANVNPVVLYHTCF